MPVFLDSHHGAELPLEDIRGFLRGARSGASDGFGVQPLDLYCGDDARIFCVMSAPDEAAVRQRHASHGVVCRRVRRVQSLGATTHALSPEEKAIVRKMIAAEVHPFGQPDVASGGFPSAELGGGWVRQVG